MAQTYTRQSTFSDGDTITASLFNDEYNQLVNAFAYSSTDAVSTGHRHDGTAAQGGNIPKIGDLDFLNKIEVDSTNNRWGFYVEVSSAAVEQIRIQDGAIVPVTDNDIDLGTSSLEFKDLYIDGTANIDTLSVDTSATIAGLTVSGTSTLQGDVYLGNASADTIFVPGLFQANLIPENDSLWNLGSTTSYWANAYVDAVTTTGDVAVGGNLTVTGNATISGNLTFGDADTDSITLTADVASHITPDVDDTYDLGSSTKEWRDIYIDGTAYLDAINFNGTAITATAAELNIVDGDTTATSTTLADADRVVVNDAGTMVQVALTDFETYFESALDTLSNVTTVGALNAGSITSGFGDINNGSSAITTTGTVTYGSLSDGTITITAFVDEDDMTSNSATLVPTQQSVKAYVDSQVTAQDLDFQADTGGALSIDLDSETMTFTGGTGIDTSGSGNAVTFAIDSTVATLTGTQTLTNKTLTSPDVNAPDIDGGTIDNTVIGGTTAAAGTFTTFTSNGIDDNASSTAMTIASGGNTTFSGDVILEESTPALKFSDTDVTDSLLNFAMAGGTMYVRSRGGTSSYGDIRFQRNNDGSTHLNVFRTTTGGDVLFYDDDGSTEGMRWDASANRLGIGVSTPSKTIDISSTAPSIRLRGTSGTETITDILTSGTNDQLLNIVLDAGNAGTSPAFLIKNYTTELLRLTSAGNLGIATGSPDSLLQVGHATTVDSDAYITFGKRVTSTETNLPFIGQDDPDGGGHNDLGIGVHSTSGTINFYTGNNSVFAAANRRMTITSSGNVLIGRTTETLGGGNGDDLQIGSGSGGAGLTIHSSTTGTGDIQFADGTTGNASYRGLVRYDHTNDSLDFWSAGAERMSIASDGDVDISGNLEAGDGNDISMSSTSTGQLRIMGDGYQGAIALDATGLHLYHNSASRSIIFGTNETERFRILANGALAVGGAANYGTSGQVLTSNGNGAPSWQAAAGGIALTDLSVTTNSAGTAALSYNNSTGVFSYTPPDVSTLTASDLAQNITANWEWQDSNQIRFGNSADTRMYWDGSTNIWYHRTYTHGGRVYWQMEDTNGNNHAMIYLRADNTAPYVALYGDGAVKLQTSTTGVTVTGTVTATSFSGDGSSLTGVGATGIGTAAGDIADTGDIFVGVNAEAYLKLQGSTGTKYARFYLEGDEDVRFTEGGSALFNGNVTAYSTTLTSDAKLKNNIETLQSPLEKVTQLRGVSFTWNDLSERPGVNDIGLIAQECQQVFPEIVSEVEGLNDKDSHLTVDYAKLVSVLVESVKELSDTCNKLTSEVEALKNGTSR